VTSFERMIRADQKYEYRRVPMTLIGTSYEFS
jgi:hypothetical protein